MIDYTTLTDDDILFIAKIISLNDFIVYCQHNVKSFNSVRPGFRPKSLTDVQKERLITTEYRKHRGFIFSYITKYIDRWVDEIIADYKANCESMSKATAWLTTVSHSLFHNNISLCYKLLTDNVPELTSDELVEASISIIIHNENEINKLSTTLKNSENEYAAMRSENEEQALQLERNMEKIEELTGEILEIQEIINQNKEQLSIKEREIESLTKTNAANNKELTFAKQQNEIIQKQLLENNLKLSQSEEIITQHLKRIDELNKELDNLRKNIQTDTSQSLETSLTTLLEKNSSPLSPNDIDDFKELLKYSLQDIGITDGIDVLSNHLCNILFSGMPIIANRNTTNTIVGCLSHIYNNPIKHIVFDETLILDKIAYEIDSAPRIIYLDNFIGNYPETFLIPLFNSFKDKIIIISAAYNKMFKYVSPDFLQYSSYINLDRYKLSGDFKGAPEDIEENHTNMNKERNETASYAFSYILQDLHFSQQVIDARLNYVFNHMDVNGVLLYEIVPYCVDVINNNPFSDCRRLVEYCNRSVEQLINRWFKK